MRKQNCIVATVDSTSRNICCNKNVARHVQFRGATLGNFLCNLYHNKFVSQETTPLCNWALSVKSFLNLQLCTVGGKYKILKQLTRQINNVCVTPSSPFLMNFEKRWKFKKVYSFPYPFCLLQLFPNVLLTPSPQAF